ncbi:MAG: hypothetical protein Q8P81_01325 [Nanoarchaeota archaeon]|nr:hypothetical protein [Nanoarchaeota archaeon]
MSLWRVSGNKSEFDNNEYQMKLRDTSMGEAARLIERGSKSYDPFDTIDGTFIFPEGWITISTIRTRGSSRVISLEPNTGDSEIYVQGRLARLKKIATLGERYGLEEIK